MLVKQLAAEGLAVQNGAELRGKQVLLLAADVDQRQIRVLQFNFIL